MERDAIHVMPGLLHGGAPAGAKAKKEGGSAASDTCIHPLLHCEDAQIEHRYEIVCIKSYTALARCKDTQLNSTPQPSFPLVHRE